MVVTLNLQKTNTVSQDFIVYMIYAKKVFFLGSNNPTFILAMAHRSIFLFHIFYSTRLAYLRKRRCKRNRKCNIICSFFRIIITPSPSSKNVCKELQSQSLVRRFYNCAKKKKSLIWKINFKISICRAKN